MALKLIGSDLVIGIYNSYISDFWKLWPKVRSFFRPAHYKSMGKFQVPLIVHIFVQFYLYYDYLCHRWGSISKKPSVNLQRVNCGHMSSPKVTIHFWPITFDRSVIQASKQHHCVSLVNTDRMICNMPYLGQIWTLTWGQISYLTFLVILYSIRHVLKSWIQWW